MKEKITGATTTFFKGKNEANNLQLKLKVKLRTAEMKMKLALERNRVLERDLFHVKEELKKSLKWTIPLRFLQI